MAVACLLGPAACDTTAPPNPAPVLSSISIDEVIRGAGALELAVTGSNFTTTSVLRVNGADRPTQFVSETVLHAQLREGDVANYGTLRFTVFNPPPGGGESNVISRDISARRLALGETVFTEASLRDPTHYRLTGNAGDTWLIFFQGHTGSLRAALADSALHQPVWTGSSPHVPEWTALEQWSSGRIVLPRTGTYLFSVWITDLDPAESHAFRIDAIDPAAEDGPGVLVPGTVVTESVHQVGDIDEFAMPGVAGRDVSIMAQIVDGLSTGIVVELLRNNQRYLTFAVDSARPFLDDAGTGRITLPSTGDYKLKVHTSASGLFDVVTGTYALELHLPDSTPSLGARLELDGGPISGTIARAGDHDVYTFSGTAGQPVMLHLTSPGTRNGAIAAWVFDRYGRPLSGVKTENVYAPGARLHHSDRIWLEFDGDYTVRVDGAQSGMPLTTGDYTLEAYSISTAPSSAPTVLRIGDVIRERIDRPGDVDDFMLQGEPGRIVSIFMRWTTGSGHAMASMNRRFTGPANTSHVLNSLHPMQRHILADSLYPLRVQAMMLGNNAVTEGEYELAIFEVDTMPEHVSPQYVLGDTVTAEPIYPAVDIDHFYFDIAEPTRVTMLMESVGLESWEPQPWAVLRRESDDHGIWNSFSGLGYTLDLAPGRYRLVINMHQSSIIDLSGDGETERFPSKPENVADASTVTQSENDWQNFKPVFYRFAITPVP